MKCARNNFNFSEVYSANEVLEISQLRIAILEHNRCFVIINLIDLILECNVKLSVLGGNMAET